MFHHFNVMFLHPLEDIDLESFGKKKKKKKKEPLNMDDIDEALPDKDVRIEEAK